MTSRQSRSACRREDDVLDLVAIGQWPERAEAELSTHVQACRSCAGLVVAATAVADLRDATPTAVPDAAIVWHRAQARARQESTARALIPMNVIVGVAAASAVGLAAGWWATGGPYLGALTRALSTRGQEMAATIGSIPESVARTFASGPAQSAVGLVPMVAAGLGVGLIIVALALVVGKVVDR